MPPKPTSCLHLPNLAIQNFRGIEQLTIKRLGRVTLIGGRNGVGKTTVLEAASIYASRGHRRVLEEMLDKHEEFPHSRTDDPNADIQLDYEALFNGRSINRRRPIKIGPKSGKDDVLIRLANREELPEDQQRLLERFSRLDEVRVLTVMYHGRKRFLPWRISAAGTGRARHREPFPIYRFDDDEPPVIGCESLGPGLPSNWQLTRFWDSVALTERESLALDSFRLVSNEIERAAAVEETSPRRSRSSRRIVVKLSDHPHPIPLKSLGDGVVRLFAAGLALANSSNGFLLADEVENGIHYSVQEPFWKLILRGAHENNVQVLATTHSSDCLWGFARASAQTEGVEGAYVRLEGEGANLRAMEYSNEELQTVADQGIEAR